VAAAARLEAHPLSVSYSRFAVQDRQVEAVLRLPMDDMDLLLRLDADLDGRVSDDELRRAQPAVARYVQDHLRVALDGAPRVPSWRGSATWRDAQGQPYLEARLEYPGARRIGEIEIGVRVLADLYPEHRNLAEIDVDGRREQFVFQHGNVYRGGRGVARAWRAARQFTLLGIEHIFTGYDHILFLFGLLLGGRGLRSLVAIVTSFTVAHSLTLALATLGVVRPPAGLVEPAIALSIAYVGVENLLVAEVRHRWRITFAFGLVHGLGFASVLREMDLPRGALAASLFTFNLGVEVGQVAIVALMWPLLRRLERTPRRRLVIRLASAVIAAFGLFWFQQRLP
jgi:hydrogenase/urease accessory protein HupE